jgi:hypothetical protein
MKLMKVLIISTLMTKLMNTKYNIGICINNYPLQAIHLTPFAFLMSDIDSLWDYFDVILGPLRASTL